MSHELKKKLRLLTENRQVLERTYNVKQIGIFGSFAKGAQTKKSDIDILVEFSRPVGLFHFVDLEDFLSQLLNRKVDLVTRKALKPAMKSDILNQIIYAQNG